MQDIILLVVYIMEKRHRAFYGISMQIHKFFYFSRRRDCQVKCKLKIKLSFNWQISFYISFPVLSVYTFALQVVACKDFFIAAKRKAVSMIKPVSIFGRVIYIVKCCCQILDFWEVSMFLSFSLSMIFMPFNGREVKLYVA